MKEKNEEHLYDRYMITGGTIIKKDGTVIEIVEK